ncbi:pentapeptide repeat-containing protein [Photorhabdus heterorhabditis]|uniref:Pentapeptide repeat-containing protein n=1 Tax=Photorhabdus heterorhabditis TaxID=880156 RepID=A0A5B0X0J8_9GAMM|nr:pentapeptide repeat-containing protein [Photorhabdus heterorhabditis]KAA1192128.1 pentapeptide repeat-containing protein [Photorhabdus heterorhabditis]
MNRKKFNRADSHPFTGGHFEAVDFSEAELEKENMRDAIFHSCNFYNSTTQTGCSFRGCKLRNTIFINCDLTMCSFAFADLFGSEFTSCRLIGASFENGSFADQLTGKKYICSGKIEDSNLSSACLAGLLLQDCSLKGNRWYETDIAKTDFSGSDLSGGEFSGIQWTAANFSGCDLRGSSLLGMDIRKINLSGVRLDTWQVSQLISALGVIVI